MKSVADHVSHTIRANPLLGLLLGSDLANNRAVARFMRPMIEQKTMQKVSVDTIAVALHREQKNIDPSDLFAPPAGLAISSTYHSLSAVTLSEEAAIPPIHYRFLAQTKGPNEQTVIVSTEHAAALVESFGCAVRAGLSAITIALLPNSDQQELLYAKILLCVGANSVSLVEVISTLNELTLVCVDSDFDKLHSALKAYLH